MSESDAAAIITILAAATIIGLAVGLQIYRRIIRARHRRRHARIVHLSPRWTPQLTASTSHDRLEPFRRYMEEREPNER